MCRDRIVKMSVLCIVCGKDLTSLQANHQQALSSWFPLNETARPASAVGLWCVSGKKVDFADRRAISALEPIRYGQVPRLHPELLEIVGVRFFLG